MKGDMRLDRRLVEAGVGSRSECGRLIRAGRVEVGDLVAVHPEAKVSADDVIKVDGVALVVVPRVQVYHKPVGVLVTLDDPWGRATVASVLGSDWARSMHPVGRLDRDSSGLLLFSSDGQLTQRLLHPKRGVEKEYLATVEGVVPEELGALLAAGVPTEEGVHVGRLVSVTGQEVRLVVTEGKHRMVRRMLANLGLPVSALVRERFGEVRLGDLEVGGLRAPTAAESAWLSTVLP